MEYMGKKGNGAMFHFWYGKSANRVYKKAQSAMEYLMTY